MQLLSRKRLQSWRCVLPLPTLPSSSSIHSIVFATAAADPTAYLRCEQYKQVDYSSPGLKLATVLDEPFVAESQLHVYASHTRHITIQGRGFLSAFNTHTKPQVWYMSIVRRVGHGGVVSTDVRMNG